MTVIHEVELNDELTLSVRVIPRLVLNRFKIDWEKKNPKPLPPKVEVTIVNTKTSQNDSRDEYYQRQLDDWRELQANALADFIFLRGIVSEVPENWEPVFPELVPEEPTSDQLKLAWLSELLEQEADIIKLQEAIMSLSEPTEEGIKEAEKN
jgi:hypothetical protein